MTHKSNSEACDEWLDDERLRANEEIIQVLEGRLTVREQGRSRLCTQSTVEDTHNRFPVTWGLMSR